MIDAYNLVGASLLLSAGFLADRFGRKRMLCTGYALFAIGAFACALAPSGGVADRVPRAAWPSAARRSRRRASRSSPTSIPSRASAPARSASGASPRASARASGRSSAARSPSGSAGARCSPSTPSRALVALAIVLRVVPRSRSAVARRIDVAGQLLVTGLPGDADLCADRGAALRLRLDAHHRRRSRSPCVMFVAFIVVELRVGRAARRPRLLPRPPVRGRRSSSCVATFFTLRRLHLLQRALPPGHPRLLGARGGRA